MNIPSPILQTLLRAAHERALHLHADALGIEHVVETALKDEDSAACQAVTFAFADPETLSEEILALSDGLMVVGSKAVLPFSPRGVSSLEVARERAAERGAEAVLLIDVLQSALDQLPQEVAGDLTAGGLPRNDEEAPKAEGETVLPREGPLFRHFHNDARRGLSMACKTAAQQQEQEISPAHLILGALAAAPHNEIAGLRLSAAREILRGRCSDASPAPDQELPTEPSLEKLLGALGPEADSLDLLAACHEHGSPELQAALERHKISSTLLSRARSAWKDETPKRDS